ncbi:MAG: molybdopterin molybdenumtransferase MoeA, partial [Pseudomonadota bacterium]
GLLFLRPAIDALLGCPQDGITRSIPTHDTLPANGPREHYVRARTVRTDDGVSVQAFVDQDSSLVKFLAQADVLIVRPVGAPAVDPGGLVPVVELPAGPTNL